MRGLSGYDIWARAVHAVKFPIGLEKQPVLSQGELTTLGLIEYIAFPDALRGKYQCHTQADLTALRATGCHHALADVQTGVAKYVGSLAQ